MKISTVFSDCRDKKTTVLALYLCLMLGLLVSDRILSNAGGPMNPAFSASRVSAEYTDCLWYAARNHGFYAVQKAVAGGDSTADNALLWKQFVESIGSDECGSREISLEGLSQALAVSVSVADQYFLAAK